jgi:YHS domain-containing protein
MKQMVYTIALTLVMGTFAAAGAGETCCEKPAKGTKASKCAKSAVKKAICPVCAVKGGHKGPEIVKATLKYKGKEYGFCNLGCKAEFIASPPRYASAVK